MLPVSENLAAAFQICSAMSTDELLELAVGLSDDETINPESRDQFATAIATTIESRLGKKANLN